MKSEYPCAPLHLLCFCCPPFFLKIILLPIFLGVFLFFFWKNIHFEESGQEKMQIEISFLPEKVVVVVVFYLLWFFFQYRQKKKKIWKQNAAYQGRQEKQKNSK